MFINAEAGPEATPLWHIADTGTVNDVRFEPGHFAAKNTHAAGADALEADNRIAQGGLSHAVATHHRHDARLQFQGNTLQDVGFAIVDV